MENKNPTLLNLNANDLVEIAKRVKSGSARIEFLKNQLLANPEDVIEVSTKWGPYEFIVQGSRIEDFLRDSGFTIIRGVKLDDFTGGIGGAFEYESVEIDYGVYQKVPSEGYFGVNRKRDNLSLVIEICTRGNDGHKITIHGRKENEDEVKQFLESLRKFSHERNILRGKKLTSDFSHIPPVDYTWDSIILNDGVKEEIRKNIELLFSYTDVLVYFGVKAKRGLILKGPPGTGKTLIGKVLCNTLKGITFLWVTPGDLTQTMYVRQICETARSLAPTILFLEDIDLYGTNRETENRGILGELMNQLDGVIANESVAVIATTNKPDVVETALRNRPGRFDRIIEVGIPNVVARKKMLTLFLENAKLRLRDDNNREKFIDKLVEMTDQFTGAHLAELVKSAVFSAIEDRPTKIPSELVLTFDDFSSNISAVKNKDIEPSIGFSPKKGRSARSYHFDDDDDY